jgi:hypothetical protein
MVEGCFALLCFALLYLCFALLYFALFSLSDNRWILEGIPCLFVAATYSLSIGIFTDKLNYIKNKTYGKLSAECSTHLLC